MTCIPPGMLEDVGSCTTEVWASVEVVEGCISAEVLGKETSADDEVGLSVTVELADTPVFKADDEERVDTACVVTSGFEEGLGDSTAAVVTAVVSEGRTSISHTSQFSDTGSRQNSGQMTTSRRL